MESTRSLANSAPDGCSASDSDRGTLSTYREGMIRPDLPVGSPERRAFFAERDRVFAEDWTAAEAAVARERREAKGDLYFVRVGKFVKIGHTTNLAVRMRMIDCHAPEPPELLAVIAGAGWLERTLHRQFKAIQSNKEWFRLTPEVKAEIVRLKGDATTRLSF